MLLAMGEREDSPSQVSSGPPSNPRSKRRPSELVAADLRRRIRANEWARGQALPTIAALSEEYGVSRKAATRAVHALAADGLVEVVGRWGTFRADDEDEGEGEDATDQKALDVTAGV